MGGKVKDKTKVKTKEKSKDKASKTPTREQLADKTRLATIAERGASAKSAADAIKAALSGNVKSKAIKFSDSESEDDEVVPVKKVHKLAIMDSESDGDESDAEIKPKKLKKKMVKKKQSDSSSDSDSDMDDGDFMETQSNASSEDFFDRQAKEKLITNDPRFQTGTADSNNAESMNAEKMGIMSMLADISGKKQIYVSEQREQFIDPSKLRYDPAMEKLEEEPVKKKVKLSKKEKLKKFKTDQDTNRFMKIDSTTNLTDLFGANKKIDTSGGGGGGFSFDFGEKAAAEKDSGPKSWFELQSMNQSKTVSAPAKPEKKKEVKKQYAKTFEGLSSSSDDSSSEDDDDDNKSDNNDEKVNDETTEEMETGDTVTVKYHKLCDVPIKSDQEIFQNWESKRDKLLESVRKRFSILKKQNNPDKNVF